MRRPKSGRSGGGWRWSQTATPPANPCSTTWALVPPKAELPPLREIDLVGSARDAIRNAPRILPGEFHLLESKPVSYNYSLLALSLPPPDHGSAPRLGAWGPCRRWGAGFGFDFAFGFGR